jgi:hypothetical protein
MVGLVSRRLPVLLVVLLACGLLARPAGACPFCSMQGQTLLGEVGQAQMVLYGTLTNANEERDETDLKIEAIIKDDKKLRGNRMKVTLGKFVDLKALDKKKYKYLVFCELYKSKIDPYRGVPVKPDSKLPRYLKAALEVKDKSIGKRLRFFFDYLDNPEIEIANDAYKAFANADYKDYKAMAKILPADRIVKWLKDPNTPTFRFGLYASLLGHCGRRKDAALLRKLLDDPERRLNSGVDGMFAAYTMLEPRAGWKYVKAALKDTKQEFLFRYAALRAVRFLHDFRTDLVSKKELVEALCLLLKQEDMADLGIEDLRKWGCWDKADRVLAVRKTDAYQVPIVRRALLRYCLSCKGNSAAKAYVAAQRKVDAEAVKDAEELLELEREGAEQDKAKPDKAKPDKGKVTKK